LVELLARDFIFNPERTRDNKRLTFMLVCLFLGAALMALLGKWA
jgi:zinc transporter 1/2/3